MFTPGDERRLFRLERKQSRLRTLTQRGKASVSRRSIVSVEKVPSVPTQRICVAAPDHLFVAGVGCVLNRNSDMCFNWVVPTPLCAPADKMRGLMQLNVAAAS